MKYMIISHLEIPIGSNGDSYDRTIVRMKETLESIKIIEQILSSLPEGALCSRKPLKSAKLLCPPKGLTIKQLNLLEGN